MEPMYIDIHVLQTVPPSNLNRDDTGSPKSAVYGGVRRARVSSQAWKRATRDEFAKRTDRADLGVRTKRSIELVADLLTRQHGLEPAEAVERATATLAAAGISGKAPRPAKNAPKEAAPKVAQTEYLIFLSRRQIERLAALAAASDKAPSRKEVIEALDREHGVEVALFGRMVADNKELSVDASVQVAHALSTHGVDDESDYFTAVDDLTDEQGEETGAGMLGTVEFNSSTLYRYATVNVAGLQANLGSADATARAARAFLLDFVRSMPTGKQNTFANRTVADGLVVMFRRDQPVNLVGAYERAVSTRAGEGRVSESARRLIEQAAAVTAFVSQPERTLVAYAGAAAESLSELGEVVGLDDLADQVERIVLAAVGASEPS